MRITERLRRLEGRMPDSCATCGGMGLALVTFRGPDGTRYPPKVDGCPACGKAVHGRMSLRPPEWDGWTRFPDFKKLAMEQTGMTW